MPEESMSYKKVFHALFAKYWLIIFLARAFTVSVTMFSGTWLFLALLGPIAALIVITSPEVELAARLFEEPNFAQWLISLLLMAVTSAILAAIVAASVVLLSRYLSPKQAN